MRRTLAAAAVLAVIASPALAAGSMSVPIDTSERVTLKGGAANVFVGNATIADVAIINRNTLVVTGKGYGQTNLLVLDSAGRTIFERMVQVSSASSGRMTLYRAASPSNYACGPSCEPVGETSGQGAAPAAAGAAAPAPAPSPAPPQP